MHVKFFISILFEEKKKMEDLKILSPQNHVIVTKKSSIFNATKMEDQKRISSLTLEFKMFISRNN